jgi:hypothetical protein
MKLLQDEIVRYEIMRIRRRTSLEPSQSKESIGGARPHPLPPLACSLWLFVHTKWFLSLSNQLF